MARKTTGEKKTCLKCANEYAVSSFYTHRNPLIHEKFGLCKKCVKNNVDLNNMDTLMDFLRTMDIPYLKDFWKQANEHERETIGTYLKNVNSLKQNAVLRFKDSDNLTSKTNKAELTEIDYEDFEITQDIIRKWGRNLEKEDYINLEEEFRRFGGYQAENNIQENICRNMARTQWMANKALEEGDAVKWEKMSKILSTQMNDANVKPVQVKSASEDGQMKTWGEIVRYIEETEPVTEKIGEYEPTYIKEYMGRWFITQMKRVFGKATEEEVATLAGEE